MLVPGRQGFFEDMVIRASIMARKKKSLKVLVVGDDPQRLYDIIAKKKAEGIYTPVKVCNGQEALQVASNLPPFDLLLTDILTSKSDGVDFLKLFTKLYPRTKVIYMIL